MTINEVAGLLGYSRERVQQLLAEGVMLPKSGVVVKLQAAVNGDEADISEAQFNEFVGRFEAEEPGRWPPATVRRDLLVEASHRCAICDDSAPLQFHHMLDWAKIKHHDSRHMIAICGTCHTRCTNGDIDYQAQLAYKSKFRGPGAVAPDKKEELQIPQNVCHGITDTSQPVVSNPLHEIIDLLTKYHCALDRVHHANTRETRLTSLDEWRSYHPSVWGKRSVRDDTIRSLADPAKEWLSQINCRYVHIEDSNLIEEAARVLSGFAVGSFPMSMPDVYSKTYSTEAELWQQWNRQGEHCMALHALIVRLKELAGRAGQKWNPAPQAR